LLKVLSKLPRGVRSSIEVPDAYWESASRVIVNAYTARLESDSSARDKPEAESAFVLDAVCAIVETALKPSRFAYPDFRDGDVLHVYIDRQTDVWVQRVNIRAHPDGPLRRANCFTASA
jgi:hypothetical protein